MFKPLQERRHCAGQRGKNETWRSVGEHSGRKRVRSQLKNRLQSSALSKWPVDKNLQQPSGLLTQGMVAPCSNPTFLHTTVLMVALPKLRENPTQVHKYSAAKADVLILAESSS